MHYCRYITALLLVATAASAQTPDTTHACADSVVFAPTILSDTHRALWRTLTLSADAGESGLFRSASHGMRACADSVPFLGAWRQRPVEGSVDMLPVQVAAFANSEYPRSVNDGAAWTGKGWTLGAAAGVQARWRFLRASLAPEIYQQQNEAFRTIPSSIPARSSYSNPFQPQIDDPTRFGENSFTTVSLGQSYIAADAGPVEVTLGRENLWIGAADVYPILLSYTAPGFSHVRVGTREPIELPFARIEFQVLFASLNESDYFDTAASNDNHYFTTTMLVVQPAFLPGLSLGLARAYHDTASATGHGPGFYASRLLETPFGEIGPDRGGNSIGVLLARWVLPASKFEAYAEWSHEDTSGGLLDALREPDWTQAYVLGVGKGYVTRHRVARVYAELIHLGESAPARAGSGFFSYYTDGRVVQGHTNQGQLLGAAIGPGSDAQLIGVDVFSASSRTSFRVERTRYDDDTYYRSFARYAGETGHDAEITLSASRTQRVGAFEVEGGLAFSRRYGRQFVNLFYGEVYGGETNWSPRLRVSWQPPRLPINR